MWTITIWERHNLDNCCPIWSTLPAIWIQKLFYFFFPRETIGSLRRRGWSHERAKISVQAEQSSGKVLLLNEVRVYWFIRGKRKGSCRGTCPIIRAVRLSGRLATVSFRFPSFWTRNRDGILTSCATSYAWLPLHTGKTYKDLWKSWAFLSLVSPDKLSSLSKRLCPEKKLQLDTG